MQYLQAIFWKGTLVRIICADAELVAEFADLVNARKTGALEFAELLHDWDLVHIVSDNDVSGRISNGFGDITTTNSGEVWFRRKMPPIEPKYEYITVISDAAGQFKTIRPFTADNDRLRVELNKHGNDVRYQLGVLGEMGWDCYQVIPDGPEGREHLLKRQY